MSLIINPGSHIGDSTEAAWTNTYEGALAEARRWLQSMVDDGIGQDIELIEPDDKAPAHGRWIFTFRHRVTGATADLETDGISDVEAYKKRHIFAPRQYWNGESLGSPKLSDWAAPGFVQTFRPAGES